MQYTNSEIAAIIAERIHNERDRRIMRMKLIDGMTYERIAEEVEMSPHMGRYGYRSNRRGGQSYQRRDSRGRYSRENRGGYSRDDAKADMVDDLRELMRDAPDEHTRMRFKEFIREIENV